MTHRRDCSGRVRDLVLGADGSMHPDETGVRIEACSQWLHALSLQWLMVLTHERGEAACWGACTAP